MPTTIHAVLAAVVASFILSGCAENRTSGSAPTHSAPSPQATAGTNNTTNGTSATYSQTTAGTTGSPNNTSAAGGSTSPPPSGTGTSNTASTSIVALEINARALNVRRGPGTAHGVIGLAHQDERYGAFERSGNWARIWFDDGPGWISLRYARTVNVPVVEVTAQRLNVRTGPGTRYRRLGELVEHSLRVIAQRSGNWAQVAYDGRQAWVAARYLTPIGPDTARQTTRAADRQAAALATANTPPNTGPSSTSATSNATSGTTNPNAATNTHATSSGSGASATGSLYPIEVTAHALNVRANASASARILGTAHAGEHYATFEQQGNWLRIWFDNGPGWISAGYTRRSSNSLGVVTATLLNVRRGPGTGYGRVGQLVQNAVVVVQSSSGNWREISFDGRQAWVHGRYLGTPSPTTQRDTLTAANGFATSGASTGGSAAGATGNPQGLPRSRRGFLQLPASGPGFYSYAVPQRRWGRDYLVYGILRIGQAWTQTGYGRMGLGDLSYANGGPISGHRSHQKGVDVDVSPVRHSGEGRVTIHDSAYSRTGTQMLIDLYYRYTPVTHIFFNDRYVRGVQSWPNHDNHFHVRVVER